MSRNKKWYVTRKPRLQLEILACLVLYGKQSKGMTESLLTHRYHADIINAFQKLENNSMIRRSNVCNFGARGKPQYYYEITHKGLEILITYNDANPLKFWKTMIGYCHHYDEGLTSQEIEKFYTLLKVKFMKYQNHGFSFQLDIFANMCQDWLDNIIKTGRPSMEQKVIEILAIHRELTFEQLAEKLGVREQELNRCISTYTLKSYKPPLDKTIYLYQGIIGKKNNKGYWDFLLHSAITSKQDGKDCKKTYELSLFGVILALFLVRYDDMSKLKQGLHYNEVTFVDYYDNIAYNYQDKLPLIFGKWKLLKNALKLRSAYNFDIILIKEIRLREPDKFSITRGGNKELHDSIKEIKMQTRLQLANIANAGRVILPIHIQGVPNRYFISEVQDEDYFLKNNIDFQGKPDLQKINVVIQKLYEIILSLNPLEYGFTKSSSLEPEIIEKISRQLEKEFADEITAYYYFELCSEYQFERVEQPSRYYSSIKHGSDQLPISPIPKRILSSILQNDKENPSINEWYYGWMNDINRFQEEVYRTSRLMTKDIRYLTKPIMY